MEQRENNKFKSKIKVENMSDNISMNEKELKNALGVGYHLFLCPYCKQKVLSRTHDDGQCPWCGKIINVKGTSIKPNFYEKIKKLLSNIFG